MAEPENELQEYGIEPDIDALKADFERCRTNLSYYLDLSEENRDVRRNLWAGKSKTSRKESVDSFPWMGSSDLEGNLVGPDCGCRYCYPQIISKESEYSRVTS